VIPRFLTHAIPLGATLGKSEIEQAAALILFALHELGREWSAAVAEQEITSVLRAAFASDREPVRSWARNPFLRPSFYMLVQRGFATRGESPSGPTLTLTATALDRVAAHLVPVPMPEVAS
jgi:hypothetical protein